MPWRKEATKCQKLRARVLEEPGSATAFWGLSLLCSPRLSGCGVRS